MQFLVIGKNIDSGYLVPPDAVMNIVEQAILPSFQMLAQLAGEGKVHGGTFPGERAGAVIVEADSFEELDRFMNSLPFFGQIAWEIKALMPFDSIARQLPEYIANVRRMTQGGQ